MEVSPLARGMILPLGATPIRSITERLSLFPSSLTRHPIGSPCGWLSHKGRMSGLPRFAGLSFPEGLGSAYPPEAL